MNALVTGDRGFLGRHLCPYLRDVLIWNVWKSNTAVANLLCYDGLQAMFSYVTFDYIFHLACYTKAGDFCLSHKGEQWEINQIINTNILRYWREYQPQAKMVVMGSSCSYAPDLALTEENYLIGAPDPGLATYAMIKRMLLVGLQSYAEQYGLKYVYFIPSTLYGPNFDKGDHHFIFDLIQKIRAGKIDGSPVELWGDGHQKRELIYVRDAVNIILSLLNSENEVFNLGSGKEYSIRDYAAKICQILEFNPDLIKYDTSKYVGVKSKQLDITKLMVALPSCKFTSLDDGLIKTIDYCMEGI